MKKLFIILVLIFTIGIGTQTKAQTGEVFAITPDTLLAVETLYFTAQISGTYNSIAFTTLFSDPSTGVASTPDGNAILEASVDGTSYVVIDENAQNVGKYIFFPTDSVTIVEDYIWNAAVIDPSFKYYRVAATGTANDTTLVTVKYILK
jgi:hypothetical protein